MAISMTQANGENIENPTNSGEVDWCHVHQSIQMLLLAMGQIELSLIDGEQNVNGLGALFTDMAGYVGEVNTYIAQHPDTPDEIKSHSENLESSIKEGVVAFQFYDRVSQRLHHVVIGLALMEEVLGSHKLRSSPEAWQNLQKDIQESYSLDCERQMFSQVLKGVSIHEALELYKQQNLTPAEDDIELF